LDECDRFFDSADPLGWIAGITPEDSSGTAKAGQLKVMDHIAEFYAYFIEWRLPLGAALYSPSKRCFVSQAAFDAEHYCSLEYVVRTRRWFVAIQY
jgi:hypothetical protein